MTFWNLKCLETGRVVEREGEQYDLGSSNLFLFDTVLFLTDGFGTPLHEYLSGSAIRPYF